VPIIALGKADL